MDRFHDVSLALLVEAYSLPQAERLAYIDLCLRYLGRISRADIMSQFNVAQAAASKDLALYRELKPDNAQIDTATKSTVILPHTYTPLVKINVYTALNLLQYGFSRSELLKRNALLPIEEVDPLYQPERLKEEQVAIVTRAIKGQFGIRCFYGSKSGEHGTRLLFPSALFVDRKNWYFRAYERNEENVQRSGFKNFKLSRLFDVSSEMTIFPTLAEQTDNEWHEKITFIITFKKQLSPETIDEISREFSINGNVHSVTCRAALACYVKTNWKIDLTGDENKTWLYFDVLNKEALQDVESLASLWDKP
ncbi:TPA: WYL domain-containing protein [Providencia alcalifaciens]